MNEEITHRGNRALSPICGATGPATKYDSYVNCPECLKHRIRKTARRLLKINGQTQTAQAILDAVGATQPDNFH